MFLNYYHFHKLSLTFRDWTIDSQAVSQRDIHKILLPQPMLVVLSAFSFVFCVIYCVEVTSLVIGKYGSLSICRDFRCFLPSAFIIFMNVPHLKFLLLLNLFRLFIFFYFCLFVSAHWVLLHLHWLLIGPHIGRTKCKYNILSQQTFYLLVINQRNNQWSSYFWSSETLNCILNVYLLINPLN